jgi:two-component system response regulator GlrR
VVGLRLPSLAERTEDISLLARHFLEKLASRYGREKPAFAPDALELLAKARWPGNVRQLVNVVEQSVALCPTEIIPAAINTEATTAIASARSVGSILARKVMSSP